jgi:hypothetical protein
MKYYLPIAFVLALLLFACKKHLLSDQYITLSYQQTYCADPWMNQADDSLTLKNVAAYLNSASLYVAGLSIKQETSLVSCAACNCKTGKIIYVTTLDADSLKAKYQRLGFK